MSHPNCILITSCVTFISPINVHALLILWRSLFSEDLTPLFNWNTKQLFLYLEAEYENADGVSITFILLPSALTMRRKKRVRSFIPGFHSRCCYDVAFPLCADVTVFFLYVPIGQKRCGYLGPYCTTKRRCACQCRRSEQIRVPRPFGQLQVGFFISNLQYALH